MNELVWGSLAHTFCTHCVAHICCAALWLACGWVRALDNQLTPLSLSLSLCLVTKWSSRPQVVACCMLLLLLLRLWHAAQFCAAADTAADLCGTICCSTSRHETNIDTICGKFWGLSAPPLSPRPLPLSLYLFLSAVLRVQTCLICILKVYLLLMFVAPTEIGAKGSRISSVCHQQHTHRHTHRDIHKHTPHTHTGTHTE